MKLFKRISTITFAFGLVLGLGATKGLTSNVVQTKATNYSGDLYLRGSFNSWEATDKMTEASGIYTITKALAKDDTFKIGSSSWADSWGYTNVPEAYKSVFGDAGSDNNIKVLIAGTYTIELDARDDVHKIIYVDTQTYIVKADCTGITAPTTLYCYAYDSSTGVAYVAWPGKAMTIVENVHRLEGIPTNFDMVIFNNNDQGETVSISTAGIAIHAYDSGVAYKFSSFENTRGGIVGYWHLEKVHELNYNIARLWLDRNTFGTDLGNIWTIHLWSADYDDEVAPSLYVDFDNREDVERNLVAFDVPVGILTGSYQFKLYNDATGAFQYATEGQTYTEGDNAKLFYISYDEAETKYASSRGSIGDDIDSQVPASAIKEVLTAYYTCRNDKNTGFGAIYTLIETWIKHQNSGTTIWHVTEDDMKAITMKDCAKEEDYEDGNRTVDVTVYVKYQALKAQFDIAHPSAIFFNSNSYETNTALFIILGVAVLGITTAGYFYFSKKRKVSSK